MLRKAYVYKLYPSKSQARRMDAVRETCRRFYNDLLADHKTAWKNGRNMCLSTNSFGMSRSERQPIHGLPRSTVMCYRSLLPISTKHFRPSFGAAKRVRRRGIPGFVGITTAIRSATKSTGTASR